MLPTQGYGTGGSIATYGYTASELLRIFRELIAGISLLRSPGTIVGRSEVYHEIGASSYPNHGVEGCSLISKSIRYNSLLGLEGPDDL